MPTQPLSPGAHSDLALLLGGYLHQDWRAEWPSVRAAIEGFVRGEPAAVVRQAASDARTLASSSRRDDELAAFLDAAGCAYDVTVDGYSARTWLAAVAAWLDVDRSAFREAAG